MPLGVEVDAFLHEHGVLEAVEVVLVAKEDDVAYLAVGSRLVEVPEVPAPGFPWEEIKNSAGHGHIIASS